VEVCARACPAHLRLLSPLLHHLAWGSMPAPCFTRCLSLRLLLAATAWVILCSTAQVRGVPRNCAQGSWAETFDTLMHNANRRVAHWRMPRAAGTPLWARGMLAHASRLSLCTAQQASCHPRKWHALPEQAPDPLEVTMPLSSNTRLLYTPTSPFYTHCSMPVSLCTGSGNINLCCCLSALITQSRCTLHLHPLLLLGEASRCCHPLGRCGGRRPPRRPLTSSRRLESGRVVADGDEEAAAWRGHTACLASPLPGGLHLSILPASAWPAVAVITS